ncbi:hypothetical protein SKAU_G00136500 [Synaphobranchus kaupii]|uniref:Uncharacterized protein n=1 Tax=Synaphobranchus kaupii TaxID=118154 RepID=A0A9Q1J2V8_SYNKA|nr:hypothetical protein SKAU_G00136500 [Synaphobranchus kaupii]
MYKNTLADFSGMLREFLLRSLQKGQQLKTFRHASTVMWCLKVGMFAPLADQHLAVRFSHLKP